MPLVTRTTTQGNIFKQETEPDNKENGSLWVNTSVDAPSLSVANGTIYKPIKVLVGSENITIEAMI